MVFEQLQNWLTFSLGPSITAIILATIVALSLPLLLHYFLYRSKSSSGGLPIFLLAGPSGSGKTSLLTLLERGDPKPSVTHTSQTPLTVEIELPQTIPVGSSKYRSVNDPSKLLQQRLLLIDTPGHGKLRHFAINYLSGLKGVRGMIYLVDATNLSPTSAGDTARGLTEAAEFLHDVLLILQKRSTQAKSLKHLGEVSVLIGANKLDLFSALPMRLVKSVLETEITNVRNSRWKGLQQAGSGFGDDQDEDRDWLGEYDGSPFNFGQMEQYNVSIDIAGGNVLGTEGSDVSKWWQWIGDRL